MGRDLLYKPPVPIVSPDEAEGKADGKAGVKAKNRELGSVGKTFEKPAGAPQPQPGKVPAYQASYFNADTSGVGQVNLRQSNAQALRGAESAVDLKKVVLPPPLGAESPDPAKLRGAGDLMGIDGNSELSLEALVGRHSAWAKGKNVTVDSIKARMAQLQRMIADRKSAIARMVKTRRGAPLMSTTLDQAAQGGSLPEPDDVVEAGRELVTRAAHDADGLHQRVAKMLGIKRKQPQ